MKVLISGGCKNGKSTIAEDLAVSLARASNATNSDATADGTTGLYYVATMIPHDDEDNLRIERHVSERAGKGFTTIECGTSILSLFDKLDTEGTYLIDSTTALLSNEMFKTSDGKSFEFDESAAARVADELVTFASKVKNIIFVSDFIFSDIIYEELTEKYREGLAYLDRKLAAECDKVLEVCLGNVYDYKEAL